MLFTPASYRAPCYTWRQSDRPLNPLPWENNAMKTWGVLALLLLGLLPSMVAAQDAPDRLPPLEGRYTFEQRIDDQSRSGTLSIAGTGPIYTLTIDAAQGSPAQTLVALSQGNVLVTIAEGDSCAPAALLRQSDGSLFGVWIDQRIAPTALGLEHYVPREPTEDFAGEYDFIGSYADGTQYTGSTKITKNWLGAYDLSYAFEEDENYPDEPPESLGTLSGTGLVDDRVLGFSFTDGEGESCGAFVVRFAADGAFEGSFITGTGVMGSISGDKTA